MTLSELLNTDHVTAWRWIRAGFGWWIRELAGMAPAPLRRLVESRPSLVAEPLESGDYRLTRQGRAVMHSPGGSRRPLAVTLRLPRETALVREVPTPALPDRDLRRMLALDIDRLTPFRADQVFVDVVKGAQPGRAVVAALPRAEAITAFEQARAGGLDPRAVGLAGASVAELAIDFLPQMREARAVERPSLNRILIWGAVAALATLNLGAAIGRDMLDVRGLQNQVAAQQPQVDQVLGVRRQVLTEARRRADITRRRADGEPLRMLNAVTEAVPAGAWVDRLAFDGQSVRIGGFRQDQVDVSAALRSSRRLSHVRDSGGDVTARQTAGQPFDLTADLEKPAGG